MRFCQVTVYTAANDHAVLSSQMDHWKTKFILVSGKVNETSGCFPSLLFLVLICTDIKYSTRTGNRECAVLRDS